MGLLRWLFGQEKKGKPDGLERPKASEERTYEESGGESMRNSMRNPAGDPIRDPARNPVPGRQCPSF